MTCDEVLCLQGPYLDSELDTKTTIEMGQHLNSCPACASLFAEERKLDARMLAGLNQGHRTAGLWEQIERSVVAASPESIASTPPRRVAESSGWQTLFRALAEQLQLGLRRCPRAWGSLAVLWVVICILNFTGRDTGKTPLARQEVPSSSEIRLASKQKHVWLVELVPTPEPAPADKTKPASPRPRSERPNHAVNS